MEKDAGKVVPLGADSVKLGIGHMGNPGKGVPVRLLGAGKGPLHVFEIQSGYDMRVFQHIAGIIQIYEIVIYPP
jgi:hypothetical protein